MAILNFIVLLILLSWTLALVSLALSALALQIRARRLRQLTLRPNCLLTRAPLVFLTGRRSSFYFLQYWNLIPRFMSEHGYLVEVWRLPWRNEGIQRAQLKRRLEKHLARGGRAPHVFYDASLSAVVPAVTGEDPAGVASVNETDTLMQLSIAITPPIALAPPSGVDRWIKMMFDLHRKFTPRAPAAISIGLGPTTPAWQIETRILNRAVELAEAELTKS